jgi:Ca2+-dependent lipid-binding protein
MWKYGIHKQNLNEQEVLEVLNNLNECLICKSNKNDYNDDSRQAQIPKKVCPLNKTQKGERSEFVAYSAMVNCT